MKEERYPLHEVAYRAGAIGGEHHLQRVIDLVAQGHDPNALNTEFKTPLGVLTQRAILAVAMRIGGPNHINAVSALTEHMIVHLGANPLAHDEILSELVEGFMVTAMIKGITEREIMGYPVLSKQGGNLYHVLAERACAISLPTVPDPHFGTGRAWARQHQDDGQTPLHVLWNGLSELHISSDDIQNMATERTAWLLKQGADLNARDNDGVSVLELIEEHGNRYFKPAIAQEGDLTQFVMAEIGNARLDANTPTVGTSTRKTARL